MPLGDAGQYSLKWQYSVVALCTALTRRLALVKLSLDGTYVSTIRHIYNVRLGDDFIFASHYSFALDIQSIMNGENGTSKPNGNPLRPNAQPFPSPQYVQYPYAYDYTTYSEPNVGPLPMGIPGCIPPQATMLPQQTQASQLIAPRDFTGTPDTSMSVNSKRPHADSSALQTIQVDTPAPGPPPVLRSPETLRLRSPSLYGMRNDLDKVLDKVIRLKE